MTRPRRICGVACKSDQQPTTRSADELEARAASTDPIAKTMRPVTSARRRPKRSPSLPAARRSPAKTSRSRPRSTAARSRWRRAAPGSSASDVEDRVPDGDDQQAECQDDQRLPAAWVRVVVDMLSPWGIGGGLGGVQAAVEAVPEGLLDLRGVVADVLGLVVEVVERDVELGLVEVRVPLAVGRVGADEAVGRAGERVVRCRRAARRPRRRRGRGCRRRRPSRSARRRPRRCCRRRRASDRLAELLAVVAGLVGLGGGPERRW